MSDIQETYNLLISEIERHIDYALLSYQDSYGRAKNQVAEISDNAKQDVNRLNKIAKMSTDKIYKKAQRTFDKEMEEANEYANKKIAKTNDKIAQIKKETEQQIKLSISQTSKQEITEKLDTLEKQLNFEKSNALIQIKNNFDDKNSEIRTKKNKAEKVYNKYCESAKDTIAEAEDLAHTILSNSRRNALLIYKQGAELHTTLNRELNKQINETVEKISKITTDANTYRYKKLNDAMFLENESL